MSKIYYLFKPRKLILALSTKKILNLKDKIYLKLMYKEKLNKKLNLNDPKTFNEKLQWLKLYDRNPEYTKMVDKYEVKKYVSELIGNKYIIPTLAVWNRLEDIDFKSLPNKFVLKCTHDSGGLVICKDKNKLDMEKAKKKINKSLKRNYFYYGREWPYKNVKPRIIAEKYMVDESTIQLKDYKFFCFNGKVKFFKLDFDRYIEHHANYYDTSLNILPFGEARYLPEFDKKISMPSNIADMIKLAEILSRNIPFVRVDFYNVNGKIFFGELTFYPTSGFGKFEPEEWDKKIGDMLELPKIKREEK